MVHTLCYLFESCGHVSNKPVFSLDLLTTGSDKLAYKVLKGKCWDCVDQEVWEQGLVDLVGPKKVVAVSKWTCGHSASMLVDEIESTGKRNFPGELFLQGGECLACAQKEHQNKTGEIEVASKVLIFVLYGACGHSKPLGFRYGEPVGELNEHSNYPCPMCYCLMGPEPTS